MTSKIANEMLNQQLERAAAHRKPRPPKKGVQPSKSVGISYNAKLQRIVQEIREDINSQIMPLIIKLQDQFVTDSMPVNTSDSYVDLITAAFELLVDKWTSDRFATVAKSIANNFVMTADKVNQKRFNENMKGFGIDVFGNSPELVDYLHASLFDNTRLIKSIPERYLTQVQSIVMTNIRSGARASDMEGLLRDQFGVTQRRAKMIARDQTSKINGQLNQKRQSAVGFNYFKWKTVGDAKVRDRHREIANKLTAYGRGIYRWDNPPLSSSGEPIIPGQDYQDRCSGIPVSDEQVAQNQKEGKVAKGVYR